MRTLHLCIDVWVRNSCIISSFIWITQNYFHWVRNELHSRKKKKAQQNMIIFAVHISKNNVFYLCVEEMKLEAVVRCVFHST